ncbi:MAG: hypothetical protein V4625_11610 [Pseudomonadota bacterium]
MQASPARPTHREDIRLQAGESLLVYLAAGTRLAVAAGQLQVTGAPRWLGGQVVTLHNRLAEGEASLLEESGWLTLTAMRDGSLLTISRSQVPPHRTSLMAWVRRMAALLTPGSTARNCA